MPFDLQPILKGELLELRPLGAEDFHDLYAAAADPLIWEQHPSKDRYQEEVFKVFFREALESGGALIAIDSKAGRIIGSSRFHSFNQTMAFSTRINPTAPPPRRVHESRNPAPYSQPAARARRGASFSDGILRFAPTAPPLRPRRRLFLSWEFRCNLQSRPFTYCVGSSRFAPRLAKTRRGAGFRHSQWSLQSDDGISERMEDDNR